MLQASFVDPKDKGLNISAPYLNQKISSFMVKISEDLLNLCLNHAQPESRGFLKSNQPSFHISVHSSNLSISGLVLLTPIIQGLPQCLGS